MRALSRIVTEPTCLEGQREEGAGTGVGEDTREEATGERIILKSMRTEQDLCLFFFFFKVFATGK